MATRISRDVYGLATGLSFLIVFSTRAAGRSAFRLRTFPEEGCRGDSGCDCEQCECVPLALLLVSRLFCVPDGRPARPRRRWCFSVIIVFLILQSVLIIFLFFKGTSVQALLLKHQTRNLKTRQGRLTWIPTLKPSAFILQESPPLLLKMVIPVNVCSHSVFLTYLSRTIVFASLSLYFLPSTVAA